MVSPAAPPLAPPATGGVAPPAPAIGCTPGSPAFPVIPPELVGAPPSPVPAAGTVPAEPFVLVPPEPPPVTVVPPVGGVALQAENTAALPQQATSNASERTKLDGMGSLEGEV